MKAWMAATGITVVLVSGCGPSTSDNDQAIALVKLDVVLDFRDPDSATFQNIHIPQDYTGDKDIRVCGSVNAKNAYGAYVGYERFYGIVEKQGSTLKLKFTSRQTEAEKSRTWFYYPCK
jgi:hypothetical protein